MPVKREKPPKKAAEKENSPKITPLTLRYIFLTKENAWCASGSDKLGIGDEYLHGGIPLVNRKSLIDNFADVPDKTTVVNLLSAFGKLLNNIKRLEIWIRRFYTSILF
ncbi:hypothetical protein [Parabacteroides sp. Marseille-P3160]|uniref:hypothetical protein n=1 Tax=Parabacteroides sp. Marseille-P3160 TaxID=1917887 RepID=UPI0009BA02D1|nr:hypothetical protein [Parabacteroides sp. Marseille-P3160]